MISVKEHWETIYSKKEENQLGWYQEKAGVSIELIKETEIKPDDAIIDIGSGASILIDNLLEEGFYNITAVDISSAALDKTKKRLSSEDYVKVKFVVDDVLNPIHTEVFQNLSLWHDRAVFHFILNKADKEKYINLLNSSLKKGGFVVMGTFAQGGAEKCSGLEICQYSPEDIKALLGENFTLVKGFNHTHYNPKGDERPFTYVLFKKKI
jgi:EEF1A lysine methyltransferase 2